MSPSWNRGAAILEQIRRKVLNRECLEELVRLVNETLDSAHGTLKNRLDIIDAELTDVTARLSRLYDVLEIRKVNLDELELG